MSDVITVRSLEDVAYLLNILFFNMNNLSKVYYDMFINPEPMDIELQRYDESGNLVTVTLPNRAKDIVQAYVGNGNPNGVQIAGVGALYIDSLKGNLYYKSSGSNSYGWILVWSANNLDYLAPDGNASQLTSLNASAINAGTLAVNYGGTGTNGLSGVLRGNGVDPVSTAVDGTDFLGPISTVGIICFYPVPSIPIGWLLCDGSAISRVTYSRLYNKIGITYGDGDGNSTFNIPDLRGYYIKGFDESRTVNVPQAATVGGHTHSFSGSTGAGTPHSHTRGTMDIEGSITATQGASIMGPPNVWTDPAGAFSKEGTLANGIAYNASSQVGVKTLRFRASDNWNGETSKESAHTHSLVGVTIGNNNEGVENEVKNMPLYPIIKY